MILSCSQLIVFIVLLFFSSNCDEVIVLWQLVPETTLSYFTQA